MWEIPWWVALLIAWAAGSTGLLLGCVLATGTRAERDLEERSELDLKQGRKPADVLFGSESSAGNAWTRAGRICLLRKKGVMPLDEA